MFASAALSTHALRSTRSYTLPTATKSGIATYHKRNRKKVPFQCYIPFLWSTFIGTMAGFAIMTGGCAMCVVGYYADYYSSVPIRNATHSYSLRDDSAYLRLRSLTYIGPILMGTGCFIVVVACVVVCETRDKVLRARAEEDPKKRKKKKKLEAYDLILDKVKVQQSSLCVTPKPSVSPSKTVVSRKEESKRSSFSSPSAMSAVGKAIVSIPMDIFSVELEKAKLSHSQSNTPSPASPKSNKFEFGFNKQNEKVFNENVANKSKTLPLDRRKTRSAVSRLVPSDKIVPLYDTSVSHSPPVSPNRKDSNSKTPRRDSVDQTPEDKHSSDKNEVYLSEDEITITNEPVLNQSASPSITTEESFVSLGLKNRIMNRTDIPAISENNENKVLPITVVVQASVHSENGESEKKHKTIAHPLMRQDTKESGVGSAASSGTASPVGMTRTSHGSSSDDDSLHLTDEMMRNFDTKSPPVV